jgi:hypothetical protein
MNAHSWLTRSRTAAIEFISKPASARPLAVFRIGLAAVLLAQAFALAPQVLELYGNDGLVQWRVVDRAIPFGVPRLRWLAALLAPLSVSESGCVRAVFWLYVGGLGFMLVGWRTRLAAAAAWLGHMMLSMSGNAAIYGVDQFAHIGLFYCVWMPIGKALSVDALGGSESGASTFSARLALRVLQLHLCIVYFSSGVEKATGIQWWNGEAVWRALMRPDLGQFNVAWFAETPWLPHIACWSTLLVEIGYALLIWPRRTRRAWVLATVGMHVGIAIGMGLVSFSAVMAVFNVAAFMISPEPVSQNPYEVTLSYRDGAALCLPAHPGVFRPRSPACR